MAGALLPFAVARAADAPGVFLNEVLITHHGPDDTEFVELFGVPGTALGGLSLVAVEGDGTTAGTIDWKLDLPAGATLGGNGYYLVGNPAGLLTHYGVTPDVAVLPAAGSADWLEQGSQTIALVESATVGAPATTLTGGESALDAVGLDDGFGSDTWFFGAPQVGPWDGFVPPGARRSPDGASMWVLADYYLGPDNTPTPATAYVPPSPTPSPTLSPTPSPSPSPSDPPLEVPSMAGLRGMAESELAGVDARKAAILMDRLDRAALFLSRGDSAAVDAQLRAFSEQVTGFAPRWITTDAAAALVDATHTLRTTLATE